jgi:hypothetical protein
MDCAKIARFLFPSGAPNAQTWPIRNILTAWPYYDVENQTPAARLSEFFILESTINCVKNRVFNSDDDINSVRLGQPDPPSKGFQARLDRAHSTLRLTSLVFEYMNDPRVRTAFLNTNNRIRAAWTQAALDHFNQGANPGDDFDPQQTLFGPNGAGGADGGGFVAAWDFWLHDFLQAKSQGARAFRTTMLAELVAAARSASPRLQGLIDDANAFQTGQTSGVPNDKRRLTDAFLTLQGYP